MITQSLLITYTFVFLKCLAFLKAEAPIVKTPLGIIEGIYTKSYEGRTVAAFEGIPYAKPPIGELRFKEPVPADPWSNTLHANRTYICMQYSFLSYDPIGNEDCLYLYVYVPRENINENEGLDVVVDIHGGAFIFGDPKSLAGPNYIMDRDLIYVSMNYRLGIIGFLSTQDTEIPGNNGLKDQTLALKWVKDNIKYFGGNPNSVTLTGISAGGVCVHFHYISPLSKGLFHRGHSQSGTVLNPWALTKSALKNAMKLGKMFNCNMNSTAILANCLKKISNKDLMAAMSNFSVNGVFPMPNAFGPVIEQEHENAFLTDHPYKLLMQGNFSDLPWIASNVKDEGIIPIGFIVLFRKLPQFEKTWNEVLSNTLVYYDTVNEEDKEHVANAVKKFYLNNEALSMENVFSLIKIHTDRLFLSDAESAIRLQAKNGKSPVHYYFFDYHNHIFVIYKANLAVAGHGDDYVLYHHTNESPKALHPDDNKMRILFLDFLFNYANKGVAKFKDVEWKPVSPNGEIDYLQISSPEDIHATHSEELGESSFWNSLPLHENSDLFNDA